MINRTPIIIQTLLLIELIVELILLGHCCDHLLLLMARRSGLETGATLYFVEVTLISVVTVVGT